MQTLQCDAMSSNTFETSDRALVTQGGAESDSVQRAPMHTLSPTAARLIAPSPGSTAQMSGMQELTGNSSVALSKGNPMQHPLSLTAARQIAPRPGSTEQMSETRELKGSSSQV